MEPNQISDTTTSTKITQTNRIFQVTTFSKYFTAFLFVSLPFLAAYIAYNKGISERLETIPPAQNLSNQSLSQEQTSQIDEVSLFNQRSNFGITGYADPIKVPVGSTLHTKIMDEVELFYKDDIAANGGLSLLYPGRMYIEVTQIAPGQLFVQSSFTTADDEVHYKFSLATLDMQAGTIKIIRNLNEYTSYYYGAPRVWTMPSPGTLNALLVQLESPDNSSYSPNTIALYDFLTGEKKILYTEADQNVMLAATCEAGCVAPFQAIGNKVLFCRYQKIPQSLDTKFLECREIVILQ